jgi:hypothetical protein
MASLTVVLSGRNSPPRLFIQERFGRWRDLQARYRESVGPLALPRRSGEPGTIGSAFDWMVRFMVHPRPDLRLALIGVRMPPVRQAVHEMALMLGYLGRELRGVVMV